MAAGSGPTWVDRRYRADEARRVRSARGTRGRPPLRLVGTESATAAGDPVRSAHPVSPPTSRRALTSGRSRTGRPVTASIGIASERGQAVKPLSSATDPRWVLAVRAAEALQGSVLVPEQRQQLLKLGRRLGLTLFDANLVLAIVQDQARRGYISASCPAAGIEQLAMVPPARDWRARQDRLPRATRIAMWCAGLVAAEVALIWMILV